MRMTLGERRPDDCAPAFTWAEREVTADAASVPAAALTKVLRSISLRILGFMASPQGIWRTVYFNYPADELSKCGISIPVIIWAVLRKKLLLIDAMRW